MNWTTAKSAPEAKPLSLDTQRVLGQYNGNQASVLAAWQNAKADLDKIKTTEAELRAAAFELYFPNPEEGTQRTELGNAWKLKATWPYTYFVSNKDGAAEKALDAMGALADPSGAVIPEAGFIADRLIKWEPDVSIKELRPIMSPEASELQKRIWAILQPILTIKPGMPQLEIEAPKKGK